MRLGIVNDSPAARVSLRKAFDAEQKHEVAWIAKDGEEAVARCAEDRPDLVLMDLQMPVMNGVEATRRIMAESPCPILVVTGTVPGHRDMVFECLSAGALDVVQTPMLTGARNAEVARLMAKVESLGRRSRLQRRRARGPDTPTLVAVGASAGGPGAVARVLGGLVAETPVAVLLVQHIDPSFAPGLATWLDKQTPLAVRLARDGDEIERGTVLVGGAEDRHLTVDRSGQVRMRASPQELVHRPSIDIMFRSVGENWSGPVVGVLLTGMGSDGARGLLGLRRLGFPTIVQDEDSSAVFGMPKAATELGAAARVLPLEQIAAAVSREARSAAGSAPDTKHAD